METDRQLGERIRARRHEVGLTQAEVAARASVSPTYLSDVERGRRIPALDMLDRIARAIDCLVTDVLRDVYPYGRAEAPSKGSAKSKVKARSAKDPATTRQVASGRQGSRTTRRGP
jgi:transcriptional regulator with XRE-family HTH domain